MKRRESVVAWSNQGFGHSSLDSFRPVLQRVGSSMLCTIIGGEISNMFAIGDLGRFPPHCNEHGTIYAISSDFGDRMTTQSMGLMVLLSEHF